MSKLDELIAELCPNGVEYKSLGEIATIARGGNFQKKDFCDRGVPCIHYGQIYTKYGLFTDKTITFITEERAKKQKFAKTNDIIMAVTSENIEDVCKCLAWLGNEDVAVSGHSAIISHNQNPKYLVYYFHSQMFFTQKRKLAHGTKVIEVTPDTLKSIKLPVPPLEVQREIVHILDSFTLLTAELTAELTARKKQYEFYRDNLIKKEQHISEVKKLADVANIYDSLHQTPSYSNSGYSMVRVQDIKGGYLDEDKTLKVDESVWNLFTQKYTPRLNDIVVSRVGSYGNFALIPNDKCCLGQNVALIHPNINPKYLYHVLMSTMTKQWINNNVKGASQKSFSLADIKRVPVPVPKENIQQRIAEVLDNFEAICTDLNICLPAEIEARQKQYEYYRDLLLTFAETGSTLMTDRQTDRQTELSAIKLIQYVFGYAMLPLGKVANVFRGEYITKKNTKEGTIPVILGGQEPAYYIDKYNHDGEIVVIARSGASAGFVSYWNQKIFVTDGFGYEEKSELIATKFLYYVLKNMESELNAMKRGAGVPHVSGEMLNSIELPIPSLQDQQRIVEILDRFDTLCNDLSSGLPAEIEARQKQYEYYRDKLLSFKELPK